MLDILKIVFCVPFLLYSCYSDIRTRRVTNRLWVVMLAGSTFFIIYDLFTFGPSYLLKLALSAVPVFIFVYILFQLGMFGGADAKSLIVLSIIFPAYPTFQAFGYFFPLHVTLLELFALGVLGNAVMMTLTVPLGLAAYNIARTGLNMDNPAYIFLGYKSRISDLGDKHIKLMHGYEVSGGKVVSHFRRGGVEITEKVVTELKDLSEKGLIEDEVWVTPGLPFMIPITLGFFVAAFYGDIIFELTRYLILR